MGASVEFEFRALFALSETTLRIVVMGFVGLSLKESTVSRSLAAREALSAVCSVGRMLLPDEREACR
jgi:hypothetical protein